MIRQQYFGAYPFRLCCQQCSCLRVITLSRNFSINFSQSLYISWVLKQAHLTIGKVRKSGISRKRCVYAFLIFTLILLFFFFSWNGQPKIIIKGKHRDYYPKTKIDAATGTLTDSPTSYRSMGKILQ